MTRRPRAGERVITTTGLYVVVADVGFPMPALVLRRTSIAPGRPYREIAADDWDQRARWDGEGRVWRLAPDQQLPLDVEAA